VRAVSSKGIRTRNVRHQQDDREHRHIIGIERSAHTRTYAELSGFTAFALGSNTIMIVWQGRRADVRADRH
jgi:hypothetical protein